MNDLEKRIAALEARELQRPSMQEVLEGLRCAVRTIDHQQQTIAQMQKEEEVAAILFNIVCAAFDALLKKQSAQGKPSQGNASDGSSQLSDLRNRLGVLREETARNGLPAGFEFFEKLQHLY